MIEHFAAKLTCADGEVIHTKIALFKETPQKTIDWLNGHGVLYELSTEAKANQEAQQKKEAGL